MKPLKSLGELSAVLEKNAVKAVVAADVAMGPAARIVQKDAQRRIGEYQGAEGGFPAWDELAESTKEDRVRKGYTKNDPLLRSGDLRESITTEHSRLEAVIGSKLDIAAYQEFGTNKIPPRPFLGPAAIKTAPKVAALVGGVVISAITDGQVVHESLGYNHKVIGG